MGKTALEIKQEKAGEVAPQLKKLIKQYGFDVVNYAWNKSVQAARDLERAEAEARAAQAKADKLRGELI